MSDLLSDYLNDKIKPVPLASLDVKPPTNYRSYYQNEQQDESEEESDTEQRQYIEREMNSYFGFPNANEQKKDDHMSVDFSDVMSDIESLDISCLDLPEAYRLYNFDTYLKNELPIDGYKDKILSLIEANPVVIIQGPTGCGKTTQVPQYILDKCKETNSPCNIVVTQPRRIAAINLAQRVCEERGWAIGTVCGYQVGLERKVDEHVLLTYMTTEVLLQKLIGQKNLNQFTHIVIDEVHERNKTLDFLLLIVRKYLNLNSPKVRIILMSATMKAEDFAYYFRIMSRSCPVILAPVVNITNKRMYHTQIFYIDHLEKFLGSSKNLSEFRIEQPQITPAQYKICHDLIDLFDKFDSNETNQSNVKGSVLVFLPGIHEIEEMHKILVNKPNLDVIPLHSSLSSDHMAKMFKKPEAGIRKVILSTNIAESSVTVPDATYVIDFCLTKVMTVNPLTKFSSLVLEWASHNNCTQRCGRVGRVSNGRVYRLVPREFYEKEMPPTTVPEMQRAPLESIILYMKVLDLDDAPRNVLSLAISPPNLKYITSCIWHLKEAGALYQTCRGEWSEYDGDLSFLGRIMAALPLDIHLSKMIILGHMFGCLEDCIIMAAGSCTQKLFVNNFNERLRSYKKKLIWSDRSASDFITLINLYSVWLQAKREQRLSTKNEVYAWCKKNFVNYKGLMEWEIIIHELNTRLAKYDIKPSEGVERVRYEPSEKAIILKIILCGAFYPHYFVRSCDFGQVDTREAVKLISGRDPMQTVYFTNMKLNQPGQLYVKQMKELLQVDGNVQVTFDSGSSKIFVEFKTYKTPETILYNGQKYLTHSMQVIPIEVYEAVRKRQLRFPFDLRLLPEDKAWALMNSSVQKEKKNKALVPATSSVSYTPFPPLHINRITVFVSHIDHLSQFYCQNRSDVKTEEMLSNIFMWLNASHVFLDPLETNDKISINGKYYAARYDKDSKFYRCIVLCLKPGNAKLAQIQFIDYGNQQTVPINRLYYLPKNGQYSQVPPIAIKCTLTGIEPIRMDDSYSMWSPKLIKLFQDKVQNILLQATIYSIIDDVMHVELNLAHAPLSFNEWLVDNQQALKCGVNYRSKIDHDLRKKAELSYVAVGNVNEVVPSTSQPQQSLTDPDLDEMVAMNPSHEIVNLKGPFSPLEMEICGITAATSSIKVRIDQLSVNAVLLDDRPDDPHTRLIVAGHVGQSASGALTIGQTTIMPNIVGLPMMLTLLFCPTMEPKLTDDETRVGSILCGLGVNPHTNKANYSQHDINLVLDTELNAHYILKINSLRFLMNEAMKTLHNIYDGISYMEEFITCQHKLKAEMFAMLKRKQNLVKRTYVKNPNVWYGSNTSYRRLCIDKNDDTNDLWPMLSFVQLKEQSHERMEINNNLEMLSQMAQTLIPIEENTKCLLCNVAMTHLSEVRIHLFSNKHEKKLTELKKIIKK